MAGHGPNVPLPGHAIANLDTEHGCTVTSCEELISVVPVSGFLVQGPGPSFGLKGTGGQR
jgi:hypothetical protein